MAHAPGKDPSTSERALRERASPSEESPRASGDLGWLGFGFLAGFAAAWAFMSWLSPPEPNRDTASEAPRD